MSTAGLIHAHGREPVTHLPKQMLVPTLCALCVGMLSATLQRRDGSNKRVATLERRERHSHAESVGTRFPLT
jgi:hypothetical protein